MNKCTLCEAIKKEDPIHKDWICTILKAKDQKGHKLRLMVIINEHIGNPRKWVWTHCFQTLLRELKKHKLDTVIMNNTHSKIKDHWHLVGCDVNSGDDRALMFDTEVI